MIPNLCIFMTFLTTVINVIFQNHLYPTQWRTTVVKAIYKFKGLRKDARNYRPISLIHLLSKMYDFILFSRFGKWFIPNDSQMAYQAGKSSADHVYDQICKEMQGKAFPNCN